jgi:hypothetical protein
MVDVQTISIVVAAVSVFIAAINSIYSSRRAEQNDQQMLETRQAQLFSQISSWWRTRDAVKAYGNVRYKYTQDFLQNQLSFDEYFGKYHVTADPEAYADQMTLWTFFEGIGVLVKKGLIAVELVEDLLSQRIIWIWENLLGPFVAGVRKYTDEPTQYDSIEYLSTVMKQRAEQQATVST